MIENMTLHQLFCLDALVSEGSFQAAAEKLRRAQPSVSSAVKNLEEQVRLNLLDRSGYRVALTAAGRIFHARTRVFLDEFAILQNLAAQLAMGEESELVVVIGELCPLPEVLGLLQRFFARYPATRLHLHIEAISGPAERLFEGEADLIIHHVDKTDPRLEHVELCAVHLMPVAAPGFLKFSVTETITPEQMRDYVECVIRDTARHAPRRNYYEPEDVRSWTVSDQMMKKEIILRGMGWGHMPSFLVAAELEEGRLLSLEGRHLARGIEDLVAARRRNHPHGPVAQRLWRYIAEEAPGLRRMTAAN